LGNFEAFARIAADHPFCGLFAFIPLDKVIEELNYWGLAHRKKIMGK
jgi:hypothetical protein